MPVVSFVTRVLPTQNGAHAATVVASGSFYVVELDIATFTQAIFTTDDGGNVSIPLSEVSLLILDDRPRRRTP